MTQALTISKFLEQENISKKTYTFKKIIDKYNFIHSVRIVSSYRITDLEQTVIDNNMFCNLVRNPFKKEEEKDVYLYILKAYDINNNFTNICKIGISKNPKKRIKELNNSWKNIAIFKIHKISTDKFTKKEAYNYEQSIHNTLELAKLKYEAKHKLEGYSELFKYREWFNEIIL